MVFGEWIHPGKDTVIGAGPVIPGISPLSLLLQEFLPELLKKENSTISFTDNRNEK